MLMLLLELLLLLWLCLRLWLVLLFLLLLLVSLWLLLPRSVQVFLPISSIVVSIHAVINMHFPQGSKQSLFMVFGI